MNTWLGRGRKRSVACLRQRLALERLEDRIVPSFNEFPTPGDPLGITAGPDGNLWFTEQGAGRIGVIAPDGSGLTEYQLASFSFPQRIAAGPDGNLWFTEMLTNKIGVMAPDGSGLTEYTIPSSDKRPRGITAGPDGNLWFTENTYPYSNIGRITPDGTITEFPLPPVSNTACADITTGADGNLWFADAERNTVGRITTGGTLTLFPLPNPGSSPFGITAGPDGNVWFTEYYGNRIGQITPDGTITEFAVPTPNSHPAGIVTGSDGNLWFTEEIGNNLVRLTPDGTFTEIPVPRFNSHPFEITLGPDGNLWFTETSDGYRVAQYVNDGFRAALPRARPGLPSAPAEAKALAGATSDSVSGIPGRSALDTVFAAHPKDSLRVDQQGRDAITQDLGLVSPLLNLRSAAVVGSLATMSPGSPLPSPESSSAKVVDAASGSASLRSEWGAMGYGGNAQVESASAAFHGATPARPFDQSAASLTALDAAFADLAAV